MLWTRDDRSTVEPSSTLHESCATGDADAIAEFYRLYQPELVAYARRQYADDPEGVADLAVFDTVSRLATMRTLEVRSVRAYLYRALKGRLADERARTGVDQHPTASPPMIEAAEDDPEAIVLGQLGLHELLDLLTDAEREVVTHRFVGGYSSRETARRVGRSPDAVRRLQSNAVARLRFALAALVAIALLVGGAYWLGTRSPFVVDTSPVERSTEDDPSTRDERPPEELSPTVPDRLDTGGAEAVVPGLPESATSSVPETSATAGQEATTTAPAQPAPAPSSTNPSQPTTIASGEAPTSQPSATTAATPRPTTTAPGSTTTATPGSTTTGAPTSTTTTAAAPGADGVDGIDGNDGNP